MQAKNRQYGVGIVGAGMIANIHADAVRREPRTTLVGIMDNGSGRGRLIAPELKCEGHDDLEVFVARDDIDIVLIATPSGTHAEIATLAAAAGKHCLCEKPLDVSLAKVDAMISAFADNGVTLGGVFNTRYSRAAMKLKEACVNQRFGRIHFAQAVGPWWRDQSYYDDSNWKGTWSLDGGGALMNQGIHTVDLLQWLIGESVVSINGRIATRAHTNIEVEDTACASLQFASGALATIACTTSLWPGHFRTITIGGDQGTAVLADERFLQWRFKEEGPADDAVRAELLGLPGAGIGAADPAANVNSDGHLAALGDFISALEDRRPPAVDGAEARKAIEIILAIYRSAGANSETIELPLRG